MIVHLVALHRMGASPGVRHGYRAIVVHSLYWVGRSRVSSLGVEAECYLGGFDCSHLRHPGIKLSYL